MLFSSWIERVGRSWQRGSRRQDARRECAGRSSERLEERSLLSVSALFVAGELNIALDSTDSVAVSENPTVPGTVLVLANGLPLSVVSGVPASQVTKIVIDGGDDANTIDLTGVSASAFLDPSLSIEVHAGNGDDTLLGSVDFADSLDGGHGDDSIDGNGGNDTLLGDDGNDSISGDVGNDSIDAGDGQDTVDGNVGDDTVLAGDGEDVVDGSTGNDSLSGDDGVDTLRGGDGNDTLNGMAGTDSLDGQLGNDSIYGGNGDDTLSGSDGNDTLDGQGGQDSIQGDIGDDSLLGGEGVDNLQGSDGNDFLNGQGNDDSLVGDDGNDTLLGGGGKDALFGDGDDSALIGSGNDQLFGNAGDDTLNGGGGGDTLNGGDGNDLLISGDLDSDNGVLVDALDAPDVAEGPTGVTGTAVFTVVLNLAATVGVTVTFTTADGSAVAGQDYTTTTGTLLFTPGMTSLTVSVPVIGDDLDESDENFFLNLTASVGAFIIDSQGEVLILDDDGFAAMGPAPATGGQTENVSPNDEVVGAVHVVAPHPTDPNILVVGGVNGGIWRTTNAQVASPTWTPVTDQVGSLSIGAIAFDPADGTSLVAGIGRHSSFGFDGGSLTGLLRSINGGVTWTEITNSPATGQNSSGVAIRGNTILASADSFFSAGGLFRSIDNGLTWTTVSGTNGLPSAGISDLVGDPSNPNRFYATVIRQGVFRSDDAGATWVNASASDATLNTNMTSPAYSNAEMAVANNGRIFVGVITSGRASYIGFSDNQGASWTEMDLPQTNEPDGSVNGLQPARRSPRAPNRPDFRPPSRDGSAPGGQGVIHFSMAADPNNPNLVYVGGDRQPGSNNDIFLGPNSIGAQNYSGRLFRGNTAQTRGNQWAHLTHSNSLGPAGGGTASSSSPHADSRDMAFDAAGNLIEGDDGGLYRRTSPQTNTGDWFSINGNLQITEQHDVDWDTNSNIAISGNQDTGTTQQSAPGSLSWETVSQGDGGDVAIDILAIPGQSIRYSSFQGLGAFRGQIFDAANNLLSTFFPAGAGAIAGQFVTPVVTNAVAGDRLLIAGFNGLFESTNRGATFANLSATIVGNLNALAYGGTRLGVNNPNVIYVGDGNQLFVRLAGTGAPTLVPFPGGGITGIALDPSDFQIAFVTDQSRVWRTTDGGTTWTDVTGNLLDRLRNVEYVPGSGTTPDVVLAASNLGVFRMDVNQTGQWREFGSELPNAPVSEIIYDAIDDLLVVGTMGRGAWQFINASIGDFPSLPAAGLPTGNVTSVGDTMFGGAGDDTFQGADGDDVIDGNGGNDLIRGGAGNDSLRGGSGMDSLDGGTGNDTLVGGGGKDTVIGGEGDDVFQWDATSDGDDSVSSTSGSDQMVVTTGGAADIVSVGKTGSSMTVTSGANVLVINPTIRIVSIDLGNGNDTLTIGNLLGVTPTLLTIDGNLGNDILDASAGVLGGVRLRMNGGDGNDSITGSVNDDTLDGGAGLDSLLGGAGDDTLLGGADADTLNGNKGNDSLQGDDGNDALIGGDGNDLIRGNLGNDNMNGNSGADTIEGNEGRDTLQGSAGNDSLTAGVGRDYLTGGDGDDTIDGGRNDDTIFGDAGADTIRGDHGNDSIDGGVGADTINGGDGNDTIVSGDDADLVAGGDGDDNINAGGGNDTVTGGDGNDTLLGGGGSDVLLGDDGDDFINGQSGSDTVAGGMGVDTIIDAASEIDEQFKLSSDLLAALGVM